MTLRRQKAGTGKRGKPFSLARQFTVSLLSQNEANTAPPPKKNNNNKIKNIYINWTTVRKGAAFNISVRSQVSVCVLNS